MNLLDFTYWVLNESERSYYVFEIPKGRALTELDEAYMKELTDMLSVIPKQMYELTRNDGGRVSIKILQNTDDLSSAIYGESSELNLHFSLPGSSSYFSGVNSVIAPTRLVLGLKGSYHPTKIDDDGKKITVRVTLKPSELDQFIKDSANRATYSTSDNEKPNFDELIEIAYGLTDELDKKLNSFTQRLNTYLRGVAVTSALREFMVSEISPNLEEESTRIKHRLQKIKQIDFSSISSTEKEKALSEVILFQKYLLTKASHKDIEKDLTTDAMIENFRILLNEVGSVKEIKDALR
jgi:hypothetical protein